MSRARPGAGPARLPLEVMQLFYDTYKDAEIAFQVSDVLVSLPS